MKAQVLISNGVLKHDEINNMGYMHVFGIIQICQSSVICTKQTYDTNITANVTTEHGIILPVTETAKWT